VDQIFERLERLVKSWVNSGLSSSSGNEEYRRPGSIFGAGPRSGGSGDSDFDAAMAELDDFLDTSKTETERREAEERRAQEERERRARQEQEKRYRAYGAGTAAQDTEKAIEDAYRYLGLKPYAPFAEAKAAYKKLLFKYHPDRNASSPEALKKATETSTRINTAFQIIEAYEESRKAG
jgi:hypothetical protein